MLVRSRTWFSRWSFPQITQTHIWRRLGLKERSRKNTHKKMGDVPRVKLGSQGLEASSSINSSVHSIQSHHNFVWIMIFMLICGTMLQVSKLGYGCSGLTGIYYDSVSEEVGISVIKYAFSKGITFFDTADVYGSHGANEVIVGKVMCLFLLFVCLFRSRYIIWDELGEHSWS